MIFSLEVQTVHRPQQPDIHHSIISDSQGKNLSLGICDSFQTKHYNRLYFSFLIVKPEQQIQLECSNSKKCLRSGTFVNQTMICLNADLSDTIIWLVVCYCVDKENKICVMYHFTNNYCFKYNIPNLAHVYIVPLDREDSVFHLLCLVQDGTVLTSGIGSVCIPHRTHLWEFHTGHDTIRKVIIITIGQ